MQASQGLSLSCSLLLEGERAEAGKNKMLLLEKTALEKSRSLPESGRHDLKGQIAKFPEDGDRIEACMNLAGVALYRSKESGRNRVMLYETCQVDITRGRG
jgi:GGDEF domain-containing protein